MRRALRLLGVLAIILAPLAWVPIANWTSSAGADDTEPTCTVAGSASLNTGDIPSWSLSCTSVPSDESAIDVNIPLSDGSAYIQVYTTSFDFGDNPASALPTTFTVGSTTNQSFNSSADTNTSEDDITAPDALQATFAENSTPGLVESGQNAVGNYDTTGTQDDCLSNDSNCGTADETAFIDLDFAPTTTTLDQAALIQQTGDGVAPGFMALGAGVVVIMPLVGLGLAYVRRTFVGG